MEKEEQNYSSSAPIPASFTGLDHYSLDHHHHLMKSHQDRIGENCDNNNGIMVDYMLHNPNHHNHHHQQISSNLSFADVMQFADFGPKLALNQTKISEEYQETGMIDPVYFLKFPVLNDKSLDNNNDHDHARDLVGGANNEEDKEEEGRDNLGDEDQTRVSDNSLVKLGFLGEDMGKNSVVNVAEGGKNKRKRPRTIKTSEEVESQRMTHIAVERNRRKQMNEHLRVLRSLMPGSYVQRGDQASIIGGAIEFVRELEQLLQCLESQKRRRLYGESPPMARQAGEANNNNNNNNNVAIQQSPIMFPPVGLSNDMESGVQEETAENKSCFADVEVKVLGFDAIIKILSRRRPGQLVKTIAALEDLQLNILHTNITTIEQTVLYSFNVKVGGEMRFTAEDIASSVQQIFSFIHANVTV